MLICGIVASGGAANVIVGQWNIYGLFLGLMIISAIADTAGIFDALAYQATGWLAAEAFACISSSSPLARSSPPSFRMTRPCE